MNILFLTNVLPFRRRNGGEACSSRLIARLCTISDRVLVLGRGESIGAPKVPQLEIRSLAPAATEFAKMSVIQKLASLASAFASGDAWTVQRMSSGVLKTLRQVAGEGDFDCVFIDHLQIFKWYQTLGLRTPAVLVAHNVEHQVYSELLQRSSNIFARWVLRREQRLLRLLDETILNDVGIVACLTEVDKAYYANLAKTIGVQVTIETIPSYFDTCLATEQATNVVEPHFDRPRRIGILGTWTWESNRLGVEWFLKEVLPHIDSECEVVIAGRGLRTEWLPNRVRYLGFVESAEQFFRSSDVIAIPSIAGGGIQEKTIEAINYGKPIVATDIAVRGIDPYPAHVHVASTANEFAAACCRQQIFNPVQAKIDTNTWNANRRLQYDIALGRLTEAVKRRAELASNNQIPTKLIS